MEEDNEYVPENWTGSDLVCLAIIGKNQVEVDNDIEEEGMALDEENEEVVRSCSRTSGRTGLLEGRKKVLVLEINRNPTKSILMNRRGRLMNMGRTERGMSLVLKKK